MHWSMKIKNRVCSVKLLFDITVRTPETQKLKDLFINILFSQFFPDSVNVLNNMGSAWALVALYFFSFSI